LDLPHISGEAEQLLLLAAEHGARSEGGSSTGNADTSDPSESGGIVLCKISFLALWGGGIVFHFELGGGT